MKVLKTKSAVGACLKNYKQKKTIGFVPTMGSLHEGHLKLIKASKSECEVTICSVFVNPMQFNDDNDFIRYPRNLEIDLEKLRKSGCDIVYTPDTHDLYSKNEKVKEFDFGTLAANMEGKFRPGHFNGMATIVEKFFAIIMPTKAFFGQKDLQQLQITKLLVKQMNAQIEIIGIPTVREKNGLAKSSRNNLLNENAKNEARFIYNSLVYCRNNKEKGIHELKLHVENQFKKHKNFELDYIEIVSRNSMVPIKKWEVKNENAICIAAYINGIRLIDNIIL
mgnify:CR=1 FL=1|tara:strand:- start:2626 stop:3462 length:837 start_codon:yes stop_codon:yes gene_type:complete